MDKPIVAAIYADGGVIGRNPSKLGGAWCYVHVNASGKMLRSTSGVIYPQASPTGLITNNLTELVAVLYGLRPLAPGWDGTIYTDSQVTATRFLRSQRFAGIPKPLEDEVRHLRKIHNYRVVLLAGHPTKRELARGFREWAVANRDGHVLSAKSTPVHHWNQFCDEECCRLAEEFLRELASSRAAR